MVIDGLFLTILLVTMDKNGQYVDTSVIKSSKPTRYVYQYATRLDSHTHWLRTDTNDERKLKDKDDNFICCFRCRKTALRNKRIVSCDYCPLYWHMDCLDPPMTSLPNPTRKWMCPNHADHLMVVYLINYHSHLLYSCRSCSQGYDSHAYQNISMPHQTFPTMV